MCCVLLLFSVVMSISIIDWHSVFCQDPPPPPPPPTKYTHTLCWHGCHGCWKCMHSTRKTHTICYLSLTHLVLAAGSACTLEEEKNTQKNLLLINVSHVTNLHWVYQWMVWQLHWGRFWSWGISIDLALPRGLVCPYLATAALLCSSLLPPYLPGTPWISQSVNETTNQSTRTIWPFQSGFQSTNQWASH